MSSNQDNNYNRNRSVSRQTESNDQRNRENYRNDRRRSSYHTTSSYESRQRSSHTRLSNASVSPSSRRHSQSSHTHNHKNHITYNNNNAYFNRQYNVNNSYHHHYGNKYNYSTKKDDSNSTKRYKTSESPKPPVASSIPNNTPGSSSILSPLSSSLSQEESKKIPKQVSICNTNPNKQHEDNVAAINASNWNLYSLKDRFNSQLNNGDDIAEDYSFFRFLFEDTKAMRSLKEEAATFAAQKTIAAMNRVFTMALPIGDYDSADSFDSDYSDPFKDCYRKSASARTMPYSREDIHNYTKALTYNLSFDHGFFLDATSATVPENLHPDACRSPLCNSMRKWRQNFGVTPSLMLKDNDPHKENLMSKDQLMLHLRRRCTNEDNKCGFLSLATVFYLAKLHCLKGVNLKDKNGKGYAVVKDFSQHELSLYRSAVNAIEFVGDNAAVSQNAVVSEDILKPDNAVVVVQDDSTLSSKKDSSTEDVTDDNTASVVVVDGPASFSSKKRSAVDISKDSPSAEVVDHSTLSSKKSTFLDVPKDVTSVEMVGNLADDLSVTVDLKSNNNEQDLMYQQSFGDITTAIDDVDEEIDINADFVDQTYKEMKQETTAIAIQDSLTNFNAFNQLSSRNRRVMRDAKQDYLMENGYIEHKRLKEKIKVLSREEYNGERRVLCGQIYDIGYGSDGQLKWRIAFNAKDGIPSHHRECNVEVVETIVSGMQNEIFLVSSSNISSAKEEFHGKEGQDPVELTIYNGNVGQLSAYCISPPPRDSTFSQNRKLLSTPTLPSVNTEYSPPCKSDMCYQLTSLKRTSSIVSEQNDVSPQKFLKISGDQTDVLSQEMVKKSPLCQSKRLTNKKVERCRLCDNILKDLIDEELEEKVRTNKQSSYLYSKLDQHICIKCSVDLYQYEKKNEANKNLLRILHTRISKHVWKGSRKLGVLRFLQKDFQELYVVYKKASKFLPRFFPNILKVKSIDVRDVDTNSIKRKGCNDRRKQYIKSLNGAEFSSVEDYEDLLGFAVGTHSFNDNDVGLILLPGNNYITIMNGFFPADDIVKQAIDDTKQMSTLNLSKRAGSALGFVTSSSISSSVPKLCNATLLPSSHGVSANVTWKSKKDGTQKLFKGIYADGMLHHQTSKNKWKHLQKSTYMEHLLIRRGVSRILSAIVLEEFGIDSCNTAIQLLQWINNDLKNHNIAQKKGNSFLQLCKSLCRYMCTFGRTNNFQALAAHKDGNGVSKMETVTVNGRINEVDLEQASLQLKDTNPSNDYYEFIRNNMKDGYLFLPVDGIVLRMRGGADIMNCNLDNTIHVPDLTRNTVNFSIVEGGCDND